MGYDKAREGRGGLTVDAGRRERATTCQLAQRLMPLPRLAVCVLSVVLLPEVWCANGGPDVLDVCVHVAWSARHHVHTRMSAMIPSSSSFFLFSLLFFVCSSQLCIDRTTLAVGIICAKRKKPVKIRKGRKPFNMHRR